MPSVGKKALRAAVRDEDAHVIRFQRLFEAHYRALMAYALRRTSSEADAHDVIAETFAVVWRRLDVVPGDDEALPWLYGVARRCLANQRRQEGRRSRLTVRLEDDATGSVGGLPDTGSSEVSDGALAVRRALASLRPADQEILRLVAWEELSHREVAMALGVSANAVAIRIHRARKRLERMLLSANVNVNDTEPVDSRKDEA
jgi:RNA polymerase sigma factor (sigma-70 family)